MGGQVVAHLGKILCRACLARDLEWKTLYHLLPFFRIILLINHSELSPSSNIPVSNYGHFCTFAKILYIGLPFLFFPLLGFFYYYYNPPFSPSLNIPVSNYGHFCTLSKILYIGLPFFLSFWFLSLLQSSFQPFFKNCSRL